MVAKAGNPASRPGGELALIAAIRRRKQAGSTTLRLGIGDDCALVRPKAGEEIAVTTDFSLENVHFRRDWHSAESVGHRCLARGLSDLAAMGARPLAAFLSLAVPRELTVARRGRKSWVQRFLDGLLILAARMNVPLAGGDTAESPAGANGSLVSADIVLIGAVQQGRAVLRSGARPGDRIYVTGSLGGAAAELLALERNPKRFASLRTATPNHPHLYPEPRISAGLKLAAKNLATAAIDLSDGLSTDLRHICEESNLAAEIDAVEIPVHPMAQLTEAAGWTPSALDLALHGGEDYELLFTASPKTQLPRKIGGASIHQIGKLRRRTASRPIIAITNTDGSSRELKPGGWEHFR